MHTLFRDHQQITFITLKRFCQLRNSPLPLPLLLTDNSNQNPKKDICPFYIVFQVLNILLINIFKIQLPDLSDTTQTFLFKQMHSNSPTLLTAKIQLPALLFLSALPHSFLQPPQPKFPTRS